MEIIKEKIHIIQGSSSHGNINFDSLAWFLHIIMPHKFKSLEFVKYDGTGDPYAHLRMFYRKMAPYGDN